MKNILYKPVKTSYAFKKDTLAGEDVYLTTLLFHPQKNNREYQGKLVYDKNNGNWQGITLWGKAENCGSHKKVVYEGESEFAGKLAVENMIHKKISSGYRAKNGENPLLWRK